MTPKRILPKTDQKLIFGCPVYGGGLDSCVGAMTAYVARVCDSTKSAQPRRRGPSRRRREKQRVADTSAATTGSKTVAVAQPQPQTRFWCPNSV